jgi:2-hydroxychromene-2-carboxylate isomerase
MPCPGARDVEVPIRNCASLPIRVWCLYIGVARRRKARDKVPAIDFWFEFASTYSYPAAMRVGRLAKDAGVAVTWRPFLLGPIFKAVGWDTSPFNLQPNKGRYMARDLERICGDHGLKFRKPDPFPQPSLAAARAAVAALEEGWGEDFVRAVYQAEFAEGRQIGEVSVLSEMATSLGHDAAALLARAQSDDVKAKLRANTEEAQRIGIFGAPSFVTPDGELFWGNDRLEQAIAWAKRLKTRMSEKRAFV